KADRVADDALAVELAFGGAFGFDERFVSVRVSGFRPNLVRGLVAALALLRADVHWFILVALIELRWMFGWIKLRQVFARLAVAFQFGRVRLHQLQDGMALLLALRCFQIFAHAHELVTHLELRVLLAGAIEADGPDVLALVANRDEERAGFLDNFRLGRRLV